VTPARSWVVVRCIDGSWTYGGTEKDYVDYVEHEIFRVDTATGKEAVKKAQALRRKQQRAATRKATA